MQCGSLQNPSKLLKHILEKDLNEIRSSLREKRVVDSILVFRDERNGVKKCHFTPIGVALVYGDEEILKIILEAGPQLRKQCEYHVCDKSKPAEEGDESVSILKMEPAILLTRFLSHFRNDGRWHLLIPLCEAGLDPLSPSVVTKLEPEEEGASLRHCITTTVLDEIHFVITPDIYHKILPYCDISKSFMKKDRITRFYDTFICPSRTSLEKFLCLIKHGFHDLSPLGTNIDLFVDLVKERTGLGIYSRETIYLDIFKRFQMLMLVSEYRFISMVDFTALGAFSDEDDMWIGGEIYVLNFFARMKDIVAKWNCAPKRLSVLCRNKIRRLVHRKGFYENVDLLGLPKYLKDFVTLPDSSHWSKMGMRSLDEDFTVGLPHFEL